MFHRILLALDAGEAGKVATSFTIALAKTCNAAVQVVHVNEYLAGGRGATCEAHEDAVSVVAAAMAELESAGVEVAGATYRTATSDVPAALCDLAEQGRSDVIVLGSRRRRFATPFGRGVRDRVARHTRLPVLVAPAPLKVARNGRGLVALPAQPDLATSGPG